MINDAFRIDITIEEYNNDSNSFLITSRELKLKITAEEALKELERQYILAKEYLEVFIK